MRFVLADIDPVALAKLAIVPMAVVLVVGEAYALRTIRRRPLGSVVGRRVSATGYSAQNVIGSAGIGVAAKVVGLALAVPTLAIGAMLAPQGAIAGQRAKPLDGIRQRGFEAEARDKPSREAERQHVARAIRDRARDDCDRLPDSWVVHGRSSHRGH